MQQDIQFEINREGCRVSGFSLRGVGNTDAEAYCLSFVTAQAKGKGEIEFKDGKIVFAHGGINLTEAESRFGILGSSGGGEFSADIEAADASALSDLLEQKGDYKNIKISVRLETTWAKGFTLYSKPN